MTNATILLAAAALAPAVQSNVQGGVQLETVAHVTVDAATDDSVAAVAVRGGVVYSAGTARSISGARWLVRARSTADGALLWSADFGFGPGLEDDGAADLCVSDDGATVFVVGRLANGLATDGDATAVAFDAGDGSVRWSVQLDGFGLADGLAGAALAPDGQSLAVAGRFGTGADDSGDRMFVASLRTASGTVDWQWTYDAQPGVEAEDYGVDLAYSPDGARLFATGRVTPQFQGQVYGTFAFDASSGAELWEHRYEEAFSTQSTPWALATNGAQVVVVGVHRRTNPSGFIDGTLGLDAQTGAPLWTTSGEASASVDGSFAVAALPGGDFFLAESNSFSFFEPRWVAARLDGATGARVWEDVYTAPAAPLATLIAEDLVLDLDAATVVVAGTWLPSAFVPGVLYDALSAGYDLHTGTRLWIESWDGSDGLNDTGVAVASGGGRAFVGGTSQELEAADGLALRSRDLASGALDWTDVEQATGPAYSSFRAAAIEPTTGDLLVVGGASGAAKGTAFAARLDAATGGALWIYADQPGPGLGGSLGEVSLSPDGSTVFACGYDSSNQLFLAFDANSGALLWRTELDGGLGLFDQAEACLPSADGSRLYGNGKANSPSTPFDPSDAITELTVALDAQTGAELWRASGDYSAEVEEGRLLAESPDGALVFAIGRRGNFTSSSGATDLGLAAYDAQTGALVWESTHDTPAPPFIAYREEARAVRPTPDGSTLWIAGGLQPTCCEDGRAAVWSIDASDGSLLSESSIGIAGIDARIYGAAIDPSANRAVVVGEADPAAGGVAAGFDLATGQPLWSREIALTTPARLFGVDLADDGATAYAIGRYGDGAFVTVALDSTNGDELWRAEFEPTGMSTGFLLTGGSRCHYDDQRRRLWSVGLGPLLGAQIGGLALAYADPTLLGEASAISLAAGGDQDLTARAGAGFAGELYLLLGSLSGTVPGLPLAPAVTLPLNVDSYTQLTLSEPSSAFLPNSLGTLDAAGEATLAVSIPAGTNPSVAGLTAHHAFVVIGLGGAGLSVSLASNAIAVDLVP